MPRYRVDWTKTIEGYTEIDAINVDAARTEVEKRKDTGRGVYEIDTQFDTFDCEEI